MGIIYDKWRDLLIDPLTIEFKEIKILEIFSYPYAQNDVVECKCIYNENVISAFIKIERSKMADFDAEINNLKVLLHNNYYDKMPRIIESGIVDNKHYMVLEKIDGIRLSDIFRSNSKVDKSNYLINYGRELARIHKIKSELFCSAKKRIINDIPKIYDYKEFDSFLKPYIDYLSNNGITINNKTFIHGDFHYANVLWNNENISGVLDFEYSGMGFKEQDIAWSIVLRPSQTFMDSLEDIEFFLKGYLEINNYNKNSLKWCMINAYCHFYLMNKENAEYINKLKRLIVDVYSIF